MSVPGDTDFHFWLTRSVGRSMGLSFRAVLDEGRLTPDAYRALVHVCQGCAHVASCQHWLGDQRGPTQQTRAPEFCPNAPTLDSLRPCRPTTH